MPKLTYTFMHAVTYVREYSVLLHFLLLNTHSTITRIIFESETWEDPTYQWIHFTEKLSPIEWRNEAETVPFEEMHKATAALRSHRPIEWGLLVPTAYSGAILYGWFVWFVVAWEDMPSFVPVTALGICGHYPGLFSSPLLFVCV